MLGCRKRNRRTKNPLLFLVLLVLTFVILNIIFICHPTTTLLDYEVLVVPGLGSLGLEANLHMTPNDEELYRLQYEKYSYNAWLSERIALKRELPDMRDIRCPNSSSYGALSKVSIIIAYHQEHAHTLLRTLYSIFERTESQLLEELILVNDGAADADLEHYIANKFTKLRLVHQQKQRGVVPARLTGAHLAKSDILVFLDAHVEVTEGWLPPLLAPIMLNSSIITEPVVDILSPDTFEYQKVPLTRFAFDWTLMNARLPLRTQDLESLPAPYESPVLSGQAFAIRRQYFWHLGGYDAGLTNVDGEKLELSLKTWLCGGGIWQVPCSIVGHVQKEDNERAYAAPGSTRIAETRRNFKRVVEVWFDDFKNFVYRNVPELRNCSTGALYEQHERRRLLQCKNFDWFVDKVVLDFRESYLSPYAPDFGYGVIQPFEDTELCLDGYNNPVALRSCVIGEASQNWTLSDSCHLRLGNMCLGVVDDRPEMQPCSEIFFEQHWFYNFEYKLFLKNEDNCLHIDDSSGRVFIEGCFHNHEQQRWSFSGIQDSSLDDAMERCMYLHKQVNQEIDHNNFPRLKKFLTEFYS